MAVTDSYATAATYRAVIDKDDPSEDSEITTDLAAMSRWIDRHLGRFFTKDASAVARDYRLRTTAYEMLVDDLAAAPTSVTIDDNNDGTPETTLTVNTDYVLEPANAAKGSEPEPYRKLTIPAWSSRGPFLAGQLVRVTAQFGWPAVPDAIARATCHLAAILRMEGARASRSLTSDGEVLEANPQAQRIIRDLMRVYSRKVSV